MGIDGMRAGKLRVRTIRIEIAAETLEWFEEQAEEMGLDVQTYIRQVLNSTMHLNT